MRRRSHQPLPDTMKGRKLLVLGTYCNNSLCVDADTGAYVRACIRASVCASVPRSPPPLPLSLWTAHASSVPAGCGVLGDIAHHAWSSCFLSNVDTHKTKNRDAAVVAATIIALQHSAIVGIMGVLCEQTQLYPRRTGPKPCILRATARGGIQSSTREKRYRLACAARVPSIWVANYQHQHQHQHQHQGEEP